MGTRHLVCVFSAGDFRVAQYGQWDGYPTGQGRNIANILTTPGNLQALREKLANVSFYDQTELQLLFNAFEKKQNTPGARSFEEAFPTIDRDLGSEILSLVIDSTSPIKLQDERDFACDSLYCEWAYVVDLDCDSLFVYRGFNHSKLLDQNTKHFTAIWTKLREACDDKSYGPVKLVRQIPFAELTADRQFWKDFETKLHEESEE